MLKSIILYSAAFALLFVSLIIFSNAYNEVMQYTKLIETRNVVSRNFQKLSGEINNAAVINPDLIKPGNTIKNDRLFFTDSFTVQNQLKLLAASVKDSVNIRITKELDQLVRTELQWIIESNVPDSIIHQNSLQHLTALKTIDSLIKAGIKRADFLLENDKTKLDEALATERVWMIVFIIASGGLVFYFTVDLYRHKSKIRSIEVEKATVLNRIKDGIISIDNDFRYTFVNETSIKFNGKEEHELIGQAVTEVHPELKETVFMQQLYNAKETGQIREFETFNTKLNRWFSVKIYPSLNGLTIYYIDITEHKKATELERLFVSIVNSSEDAIISKTLQGIVTSWNKGAEMIFGYSAAEIIGKSIMIVIPPELQDEEAYILSKIKTGEYVEHYETERLRKDGQRINISLSVSPILNSDGNISGASKIARDITERKSDQIRMVELNQSLQQQARELARSNEELEQFAYVASHDLQEPLRMINNFLVKLENKYAGVLDDNAKTYIRFAADGAKRMREMILDLLAFSKVEKLAEKKEELDTLKLIKEIENVLTEQTKDKNATIGTSELPVIYSCRVPLYHVFQNLISNSLKYASDNRPCIIKISAADLDTHWQFEFADNGIGIEEEYFNKIFVIFQRLHSKSAYSGNGIGLAITKKIIENLGGKIWLSSKEGVGSTFIFTIEK